MYKATGRRFYTLKKISLKTENILGMVVSPQIINHKTFHLDMLTPKIQFQYCIEVIGQYIHSYIKNLNNGPIRMKWPMPLGLYHSFKHSRQNELQQMLY